MKDIIGICEVCRQEVLEHELEPQFAYPYTIIHTKCLDEKIIQMQRANVNIDESNYGNLFVQRNVIERNVNTIADEIDKLILEDLKNINPEDYDI